MSDGDVRIEPLEAIRRELLKKCESTDYWVLPWIGVGAPILALTIESKYYDGPANADFHAYVIPFAECPAVTLAHKRRMTPAELGMAMLDANGSASNRPIDSTTDFIIATRPGRELRDHATALGFIRWLRTGETS